MEALHETLRRIQRRTELERAMRRPGGIPILAERELQKLRAELALEPAAVEAIMKLTDRIRRPIDTLSVEDVAENLKPPHQ
jgi:hypothetical protein